MTNPTVSNKPIISMVIDPGGIWEIHADFAWFGRSIYINNEPFDVVVGIWPGGIMKVRAMPRSGVIPKKWRYV